MFGIFALIALTLSAVGLYAVTAYAVSQRTQEIGIRMALGAQGNDVSWLFLRRSFVQLAIGLSLGVAGAFGVGQLFASTQLLVQSNGRDPITIGGIALLLAAVAVAASVLPAKRATRFDPLHRAAAGLASRRRPSPVTFATAKLNPFRFFSGGTPGMGRGNPDA